MNTFRDSIASIPGAVTNFINESASTASSYLHGQTTPTRSTPTPSTSTTEETTNSSHATNNDKSLPIPASLVKEQWRLIFSSDANAQDLEAAIAHCRDLVLLSEECSDERRWLVRHLVDLRYALKELQEAQAGPNETFSAVKTVVGHHFVVHQRTRHAVRYYCDFCTGIIWSVVQTSYICSDCNYLAHQKCVDSVIRICAHVIASERQYPIAEICPEIGLAAQHYKCSECATLLNFTLPASVRCFGQKAKYEHSWIEPRLCDYNGLYYCPSCHWNDNSIIPARVIHNWDFAPRKVSRTSLQEINLFLDKPLIKLEEANPKLFVFLEKLCTIKKIRQNLVYMRKYLIECRAAVEEKLLDNQIGVRRHLIQSNEFYSIHDLEETENGTLIDFLSKVFNTFDRHIRNCSMCTAKAYICEICSNCEVIYPFDDGCIICDKCNSIYHRVCLTRKKMLCPKCIRFQNRKIQLQKNEGHENENEED